MLHRVNASNCAGRSDGNFISAPKVRRVHNRTIVLALLLLLIRLLLLRLLLLALLLLLLLRLLLLLLPAWISEWVPRF